VPLILAAILVLFSLMLPACSSSVDSESAQVIARAVDALGGEGALKAVNTITVRGTTTITAGKFYQSNPFVHHAKRPGKSYYETPLGSRRLIFATNGEMAWTQNDGALAPYAMPENQARSVIRQAVFEPFYFDLEARRITVEFLGEHDVFSLDPDMEMERLRGLRYAHPDGDSIDVFFSLDTGRLRMTSRGIQTSIGPTEAQKWFGGYRQVGGVAVAHESFSLFPGEKHVTVLEAVEINEPIADSVFELLPPPRLAHSDLDALAGVYTIPQDETIRVHRDGDALVYQNGDGPALKMTAVADTLFLVRSGRDMYNVIFARPADGASESLTLQKGEERRTGRRNP
jgi:hypothetical protein